MKKYNKTGLGLISSAIVMGSIPNISGTATETSLKNNYATGLSKIGATLPAQGSMIGARMVLKQTKKLGKFSKGIL